MNEQRYPNLERLRLLTSLAIALFCFVPYMQRGLGGAEFQFERFSGAIEAAINAAAVPMTLAAAFLSYRLFEEPARRMTSPERRLELA